MRVARAIAVAWLCSFMSGGCSMSRPYPSATYVVRAQDTLYSIAWRHDIDYRLLAKWNHLGADYRVSVGQVLRMSAPGGAALPQRPAGRASGGAPGAASGSTAAPGVLSVVPSEPAADGHHAQWVWPTDRQSAPVSVPSGGILLLGKLGQDVRAASAGRVVYTGGGIRGYGNLIIIKHVDGLLSSYAHNREMLVREGQDVVAGQTIAHMGTGAHQVAALYFEIRLNGKPTDPLRYLTTAK